MAGLWFEALSTILFTDSIQIVGLGLNAGSIDFCRKKKETQESTYLLSYFDSRYVAQPFGNKH